MDEPKPVALEENAEQVTREDFKKLQDVFLRKTSSLSAVIQSQAIELVKIKEEQLKDPFCPLGFNMQSDKLDEIIPALIMAKKSYGGVRKGGQSGYSITDFIDATQKPLEEQGLTIEQSAWGDFIISDIIHVSGQFKRSVLQLSLYFDENKRKLEPQKHLGATITYLSKYLYRLQSGVPIED